MRVLVPLPNRGFDVTEVPVPWRLISDAEPEVVIATEHAGVVPQTRPRLLTGVIFGQRGAEPEAKKFYGQLTESPEFHATQSWSELDVMQFDGIILPGGHTLGMRRCLAPASSLA